MLGNPEIDRWQPKMTINLHIAQNPRICGGPVFNSHGEVIGVNAAYIDGFSGGTLGVSSQALKPLILEAQKKH
jgi:S1-C subfamily serine protease